jgi:hypothetical protein
MMEIKNPVKAIRAFCLQCCGGNANDVRNCPSAVCELKPFRFGKNPYRTKRQMTEEQKEAARQRLKKAREAQNDK